MRWAQRHDLPYFRDATGVMFMASMLIGAVCWWAGAVMQVGWGCLVGGQGLLCLKITNLANFASLYYLVL